MDKANMLKIIAHWAEETPGSSALLAPDGSHFSYQRIYTAAKRLINQLPQTNRVPSRPLVLVASNCPEALVAFLAASATAPCFPLNPRSSPQEIDRLFDDLDPETVLLPPNTPQSILKLLDRKDVLPLPIPPLQTLARSSHCDFCRTTPSPVSDVALLLYTSGTTGKPKRVPLTHRNLLASTSHIVKTLKLSPKDRGLLVMPMFHIHGLVAGVLSAWRAGGSIVCHPGYEEKPFFNTLQDKGVTWYTAVPTVHQAVAEAAEKHPEALSDHCLRLIRSSSSSLPPSLLHRLESSFQVPVIEAYGMTEATHQIACNPLPPQPRKPGSVGPSAGPSLAICTDVGISQEPHVLGEVVIKGSNVTRGYEASDQENAHDPNIKAFHQGWFRTGDQGMLDEDGYLFLTGRIKEMICRGGENIWPREVDECLLAYPGVRQAVAFGVPHPTLEEDLVAAVVRQEDCDVSENALRSHCMKALAPYKVPSQILFLDEIPKGPSGKLQRIGLAKKLDPLLSRESLPAREGTEALLAEIWKSILRLEEVRTEDHFFRLGGDSLSALRVVAQIEEYLGVFVSQDALFQYPRLKELSQQIDTLLTDSPTTCSPPDPSPTLFLKEQRTEEAQPLSTAQEGLWLLMQWLPGSPAHNRAMGLRFTGSLDREKLRESLNIVVRRHEALRSTVTLRQSVPHQRPLAPYRVLLEWLEDMPDFRNWLSHPRIRQTLETPFDLEKDPPLRGVGVRLSESQHLLLLVMPHLFCDAWTESIVARDLAEAYEQIQEAGAPSSAPVQAQCRDYVRWEKHLLLREEQASQERLWDKIIQEAQVPLPLFHAGLTSAKPSGKGNLVEKRISLHLWTAMHDLAKEEGLTPFITFLSAFLALLHRRTGHDNLCIGCLASQRSQPAFRNTAGFLVQTLPVRSEASGNPSFREFMRQVDDTWREIRQLGPPPRSWRCSTLFTFEKVPPVPLSMGSAALELLSVETGGAVHDFCLEIKPHEDGGKARMMYSAETAGEEEISLMAEQYLLLLASVMKDPNSPLRDLSLISTEEKKRILFHWNETTSTYPKEESLQELFRKAAKRFPDKIAVSEETRRVSFQELDAASDRLSLLLRTQGVDRGSLVGLISDRSLELVTAILAILKAGGAYLPLDPLQPEDRASFMLSQAQASHALVSERYLPGLSNLAAKPLPLERTVARSAHLSDAPLLLQADPSDLAYVMFTSGSTGCPKGVEIEHRGVVNLCFDKLHKPDPPEHEHVTLLLSSIGFDGSTLELWLPLIHGGTCAIFEPSRPDLAVLRRRLEKEKVTHMYLPVAFFNEVAEICPEILEDLDSLWVGGEAQSPRHIFLARQKLKGGKLINLYGVTECTVDSCVYAVPPSFPSDASTVPIGKPISNTQVYLLNERKKPVPPGVVGEIYIGGDGLGRGYASNPEQTRERFVPNPLPETPGERLYRTGDWGRFRLDGNLDFLGREDDQIKIRGFRVELAEIEETVKRHDQIRDARVRLHSDSRTQTSLICYFLSHNQGAIPTKEQLVAFLKNRLPEYMVPFHYISLSEWPKNLTGKIDLQALPSPPEEEASDTRKDWNPSTEVDRFLADQWRELLGRSVLRPDDNFFDSGGHSLLAMKLLARVAAKWDVEIPIRTVFEGPTLEQLSKTIGEAIAARA